MRCRNPGNHSAKPETKIIRFRVIGYCPWIVKSSAAHDHVFIELPIHARCQGDRGKGSCPLQACALPEGITHASTNREDLSRHSEVSRRRRSGAGGRHVTEGLLLLLSGFNRLR